MEQTLDGEGAANASSQAANLATPANSAGPANPATPASESGTSPQAANPASIASTLLQAAGAKRPVRVLVADDQDLVRGGFRMILSSYDGIEVVGEARDGDQAVQLAERLRPDVVLMDIRMPRVNGIDQLTDREREILTLVARGLNNDQIGERLFISPATVKTHLARIMAKLDAHDRAQLVVRAYESGLVKPGVM